METATMETATVKTAAMETATVKTAATTAHLRVAEIGRTRANG
jgi:hypothetical protein